MKSELDMLHEGDVDRAGSENLDRPMNGTSVAQHASWLLNRSDDDEATPPEPYAGTQGQSGLGCHQGRQDAGRSGAAFGIRPNQITQWKAQLQEGAAGVFGADVRDDAATPSIDLKSLHAKIGGLTLENDFLSGALGKVGMLSAKR